MDSSARFLLSMVVLMVVLGWFLRGMDQGQSSQDDLVLYCAAGMRKPMEKIIAEYEEKYAAAKAVIDEMPDGQDKNIVLETWALIPQP